MTTTSKPLTTAKKPATKASTIIWGEALEKGDFIKVPRALIYIRSLVEHGKDLQPRHIFLILALAARRYRSKMTRAYWVHLGRDLGVSANTVRKWAYELRDMKLIHIIHFTGKTKHKHHRVGKSPPGHRNDRNGFDISPFVTLVGKAAQALQAKREERRARQGRGGGK